MSHLFIKYIYKRIMRKKLNIQVLSQIVPDFCGYFKFHDPKSK